MIFCPVEAVQCTDKTIDREKYPRYKGFDHWRPHPLRDGKGDAAKEEPATESSA